MSDHNETNPKPDAWTRFLQTEKLRAELWPANKQAIFAALTEAKINSVVVTFDGYGDSGQVESIEVKGADDGQSLPTANVVWHDPDWNTGESTSSAVALKEAIENAVYAALERTHSGWENSSGAFGEVLFDVATGAVTLDYNERYETSELSRHDL